MRISSITKNAGKACNNRLYRHIRTFEKIVKNYFVISKTLNENTQELAGIHSSGAEWSFDTTEAFLDSDILKFHEGALRYYSELAGGRIE